MSEAHTPYEPPVLVPLGPVAELTLGGGSGGTADGSATYSPDVVE